nr:mucin-5AC-like isoform X1 [Pogona vitticeps]
MLGIGAVAIAWIWPVLTVAAQPQATKTCLMECTPSSFVSQQIPQELLKSYENNVCGGKISVILITRKNRSFCADPSADWVKKAMRKLDSNKTMPKATPVSEKRQGAAITTTTKAAGRPHPTGTEASVGHSSSAGPTTPNPSTQPTSGRVDTGATVQPEATANGDANRPVPSRPGGFREDKTPPQVTSQAVHATGKVHGRFGSELPTGAPRDTDPTEEEVNPSVTSLWHPVVSTTENAISSDSGVDPRSQTIPDLTTVAQGKDFTVQLGTRPDDDGKRSTTVSAKDRNSALHDPTVVDTTREEESGKAPFSSSGMLAKYQTHLISLVGGTVLLFLFAGIARVYFRTHICAGLPSRQMAQGLVYSPVDSYADNYSMQNL